MPTKTSNSKSAWSAKDIYDMIFSTYGNAHVNANKARAKEAAKYMIPYIPEKEIMLTTGRYNTGKISTNLLDSIYNASQRTGVPLDIALGLAGRESTLGIGRGFKKGKSVSGTDLYSNWQQIQTIPNNKAQMKKWNSLLGRTDLTDEDYDFKSGFLIRAQDSLENTRPLDENPIDNALKFYQTGKYNPGDSRHTQMVEDDAKVLMSDPAIQKWLKSKTGNQMKCGGRRKAQLGLDIREGGIAIPIANNMFYINGRKHAAGGVAIGPNNKNGVEVEGGEVVEMIDSNHPSVGRQFKAGGQQQTMRVFSSVPFLRGASPAELVLGGANPDTVFKAQEEFKDRNRINDDGTRYEVGGEKIYTPSKSIQRQIQETGNITIGGAPTIGGLRTFGYLRGLTTARKYGAKGSLIFRAGKELIKRGTQKLVDNGKITKEVAQIPRSIYGQFVGAYGQNLSKTISLINNNKEEMKLGGRIKADFGTYQPKRNEKGQFVINPNNPQDVKWLREQQGKRGAKAVHRGQQEFLEGTLDRTTPIMLGVAAANPITTATSLAGGYLLGEVGEFGGELYKGLTGEDYTREGKVIGQTIGGLGGPIGAKLFSKGATNAWNAYKSNRLNSTQTLVDVPETGLTVRPNVRTNRPKQLDVTNNQKYLPTDVEDLTWKEPKALLETQAQVTRRDLKNFNRWAKLFGYEPVPLRYAETKSIADRHVQDRIRQHNTFLRGVAKPNKLQKQAIEYELAKEGITNPTDYDVYTYMATHSAPTTGAGRADLRPIQVRKHKVGNFNLSKTSDSPIGALYTQGSGRGAAGYAGMGPESGGHRRTGVVVEVARPTYFRPEASYAEWVKENDFNFGDAKSKGFHKKIANRVVETGKAPEGYNLSAEDKQVLFNEIKNEFAARPEPVYETAKHALNYIKTHRPNILKNITQLDESAFNSLSNDSKRAYNNYLGKLMMLNPKTVSFSKEVKEENNRFKNTYRGAVILEGKRRKNKYLSDIDYNPEDYTQPDFSVLKSTSRNRGNAQQHYIFRAPIGEKILEGRGFYLPTEEEIINATTDHYSLWTPGYSRNTRKFGGIKKFKFGGSMIYTINGNIKNRLMSARPKARYGTIDKKDKDTKVGQDGLIYKRAADGEWYTDGTKHIAFKDIENSTKTSRRDIFKASGEDKINWIGDENDKFISTSSTIPDVGRQINLKLPKPKRTYVGGYDEEEKETKKIGSLTYEKNESGKWVPASKQSTTTTRDGGRPKDFGITRTGVNHPNGSYKYHPLTGEKISEIGIVETSEPSIKGTTKVSSKSSSTPRREGTKSSKAKAASKSTPTIQDTVNKITTDAWKASKTPKIDLSKTKTPSYNVSDLGSKETKAAKAKLNTSSTGGGTQSKDGRWVGQYKTTNAGDWIGLGSNLAGTIASYFMTKNAINKMPEPLKPIMAPAVKLKTKYNIQPQLTNISEAEQMNRAAVRRNTQSSNTSLAREQRLMNEARGARNTLYGQKENIETQLINQDRLNRQSVMRDNVRAYNEYLNRVTATKMAQNEMRASNINNLISGLTGSVNNILGNIESRRVTNNTLRAIAAANPNVDARLIGGFDYYIDPITKKKYNKNQQYVGTING